MTSLRNVVIALKDTLEPQTLDDLTGKNDRGPKGKQLKHMHQIVGEYQIFHIKILSVPYFKTLI